eukprot:TRINITY_DN19930_c0_g1_i1.p1 TRINITY_DN19930_c0_g1~~TRINITY_DN19930_c0_g1_i1.p1  ORF type:complete len:115 (+),score=25.68 TRINITY_DN19930_c0_g1_i1:101-445(+)
MGNCNLIYSDDFSELTNERLLEAVEHMNSEEVSRCLDGGMPVNHPIDKHGHTILDKFAHDHHVMLESALHFRGSPQDATKHLQEMQESAAHTLKVLLSHGATVSAQSGALKKGV